MSTQSLSRYGVGASEIAAIAGLNPHESPWGVWRRKVGDAPDKDATEQMEWGNRLEPAIRQAYADRTGAIISVPPTSMFSKDLPWARATPDGIVFKPEPTRLGLFQAKNVGVWVERAWSDAPPEYVQLQEHWEMFVTGDERADVGVLIGGNDFRIYTIHRDDKLIADLVDIAAAFWRRVEQKIAPPVDDSDACKQHFEKRLARGSNVELTASADMEHLFARWQSARRDAKALDKEIERIRNHVRAEIADAGASRLASTIGTAMLRGGGSSTKTTTTTDFEAIARLLGSTKCTPEEWAELVAANTNTVTTTKESAPTLYEPSNWAKDKIA